MRIEISGQIEIRNLEMMSRVKEGLIKTGCGRRERENELMRIMVSMAHIPPSLVTWCHSTWQGVGWHNNICLFPLADFQREGWHRGEVRRREGKRKGKGGEGGTREGVKIGKRGEWFKLWQKWEAPVEGKSEARGERAIRAFPREGRESWGWSWWMTMLDIFRGLKGLTKSQSVMAAKS